MSYRTAASEALVDTFQCRIARLEHNLTVEKNPRRESDTAWLDATKAALHDVYLALEKIENEAAAVPEHDETVTSVDEWLRREGFNPVSGEWVDAA